MKVFETIKRFMITVFAIVYFTFALCMTILLLTRNDYGLTQFGSTTLVMIQQEVSTDEFKKGDLVLVDSLKLEKIVKGDTIFTYRIDSKGIAHVEIGTVGELYPEEDAISYENGDTYSMEFVIGKASQVHNNWGMFLSIVLSQWGFLFIVLVPCFLIFIYEIYALIVEIKYGGEE